MKARIDGGEPYELDNTVASCLTLDAVTSRTSGRIRDAKAVTQAHLWRSLREGWFFSDVGFIAFLVIIALFAVPRPTSSGVLILIVVAVAAAIEGAVQIQRGAEWRRGIAEHLAALPPPGTLIEVDESGLTIDAAHTPWDALRVEDVSLRSFSTANNFFRTRYRVDRMKLATPNGFVILDPVAIKHGQTIVDVIWRRLQRWPRWDV